MITNYGGKANSDPPGAPIPSNSRGIHLLSLPPTGAAAPAWRRGTLGGGADGRCSSLVGAMVRTAGGAALGAARAGRASVARRTASRSSPKSATPSTSDTSQPPPPPRCTS